LSPGENRSDETHGDDPGEGWTGEAMKTFAGVFARLVVVIAIAGAGPAAAALPTAPETAESKAKAQAAAAAAAEALKRETEDLARYQDRAVANYRQRQVK
jgi:hypothetical protein